MLDALIMAATRLARGCSHLRVEPIQIEPYEPGAVDAVVVRFAYGKNGFAKKTKMISDMVQMVSPHMGKKGCWGFFFVSPSHLDPPSDARTHPTSFHGDLPNLTSVASWQMRPRRAPSRRSTLGGSVTLLLVRVEGGGGGARCVRRLKTWGVTYGQHWVVTCGEKCRVARGNEWAGTWGGA